MDKEQKLLAENYLFNAASRYFDEEPTIVEEKQEPVITEKTLYTKDGTPVNVPDDVYNQIFKVTGLNTTVGDEGEGDPDAIQTVAGTEFDATANAARVAADAKTLAKQKAATSFGDRAAAGKAIYDQLAGLINDVVKNFAKEKIDDGIIAYDDEEGEWVIAGDDPKAIKLLLSQLEVTVYNEVIKPAKTNLKKSQQDALLATFHQEFTNPNHVKDGTPAFKGAKKLLKAALKAGATEESAEIEVDGEALQEAFYKAVDTVLAEMYAERYDVKLDEAAKMFIVKDTQLNG